ncbi:hypothetical protein CLV92_102341 [Kineococcus xinjiangensis]|uniref:ARB-07466-like C-terminal domain-containing protein n=1 Tax=Kineococcus xinjiangensis TaxID=512762 RepID=A0A2S6IVF5_9ACTN|nr:hypothetical protein [Kineococcus xinjiangensis]PPK98188.1 hypothetical protein CLV92_102341 [Kineococcus xinjiangensis]
MSRALPAALVSLAAVLVLAGSCGAMTLMVGGAGSAPTGGGLCAPPPGASAPVAVPAGAPPAGVGSFSAEQVSNAAEIVAAARELGLDERAQAIGVMTAIGESGLRNLDRGDAVGPDSRGLFQQRANGAWGSYSDRMTPRTAATSFFRALQRVPGWESLAPTLAAHRTQRNADPYHYERHWPAAVELVAAVHGDPTLAARLPAAGALPCAPGAGSGGGGGLFTGAALLAETCSVRPDPSTGRGCVTPRTAQLYQQLAARGWSTSCWDAHAWNPTSDHPQGKACDVFPGRGGRMPSAAEKARGDALAADLVASAEQAGISYVIWYGRIWSASRGGDGWRPYGGGGVYDPGDVTGGHFDHLHVSVR